MKGWVCPECGLDYDTVSPRDSVVAVRSYPRRYRAALASIGDEEQRVEVLRRRPAPDTWSALEYAAHVADVLDLTAPTIRRMLVEHNPKLSFFDSDQQAADQRYNEQSLSDVLDRLETACIDLASVLEGVLADEWTRPGTFDWGERDVLAITRNAVHEGSHHLRDIDRGLRAVHSR